MSLAKLERDLGYRDVVPPREALVRTARWLCENRPAPGGAEEQILEDPFDYAAEDALVAEVLGDDAEASYRDRDARGRTTILAILLSFADEPWDEASLSW